jgi:hypothetical protein
MKLPRHAGIVRPDRSETDPPKGFRRFPPPWTVEDHNGACFIVKDRGGHSLAFVYYEEEPDRRSATNLMTQDEARRIAANIAKLPALLVRPLY